MKKNGFSLWEVIVGVACIAFLMGAVVFAFTRFSSCMVRADFYILKSIIVHAHYKALITGKKQDIVFDGTKNGYTYDGMFTRLSSGLIFGVLPNVWGPPANPKKIVSRPISFEKNILTCYPTTGVSAGALYFIDTQRNILYACTVGVAHSFIVKFYRYQQHQWILIA